jgi:electron transport complex protein RnfD
MAEAAEKEEPAAEVLLGVAPGPHIVSARSTRSVMIDVLIALIPVVVVGLYVFRWRALALIATCTCSCVLYEWLWQALRRRPQTIGDCSALVTGLILALSIPWTVPWYVPVIGSGVAIIVAKMFFGGLGTNIFNPAMAGRAFLQACFAGQMVNYLLDGQGPPGAVQAATRLGGEAVAVVTTATPLAAAKSGIVFSLRDLAVGTVNGSVGETSAVACVLGGLYLICRRAANWRIPLAMLATAAVVAEINQLVRPDAPFTAAHHLLAGAMLFGAFFIATDPATSPLSRRGLWIFGAGVGLLVMLIRLFAKAPEGVMYAVLVMNMAVPLIDRWTVPRPVGGPVPRPERA